MKKYLLILPYSSFLLHPSAFREAQGGPTKGTDKHRAAPERPGGLRERGWRFVFRLG